MADVSGAVQVGADGDPGIAKLAATQHGVVTRAQLLGLGLGRGAIAHRIARGRLHRIHRGVYLVGHAVAPSLAVEMAAVLASGPGSMLSHQTAAALWKIGVSAGTEVHVTVARRDPGTRRGVRAHCVEQVPPEDIRLRQGLLLTAPSRTLLDLAEVLTPPALERAYAEAQVLGLARRDELFAVLDRSPGRHGAAPIRALLDLELRPAPTRSEAEVRLLALLRAAGLPPTDVNARVAGHEVDFLWRSERLVVEIDGFAYHAHRAAFERDRLRDAQLQAAGYRVIRITWRRLEARPEAVIAGLAQALARA